MADQPAFDEATLRRSIRERIASHALPCIAPERLWGGPGAGDSCAVCDLPIGASEMELEAEFREGDGLAICHFHRLCHGAWELECAELGLRVVD